MNISKYILITGALIVIAFLSASEAGATTGDRDNDGLSDDAEVQIYGTNPDRPDNPESPTAPNIDFSKLKNKRIEVDLSEQRLRYYGDGKLIDSFPISSGTRKHPSPVGTFAVKSKIPVKRYVGPGYDLPNTKWNLNFFAGYYIHGAYWHNNFGTPMSHGCINVSYRDMSQLYAFADTGTRVTIQR